MNNRNKKRIEVAKESLGRQAADHSEAELIQIGKDIMENDEQTRGDLDECDHNECDTKCSLKPKIKGPVSEYDRALILGNRVRINSAIQELNFALANLRAVNSAENSKNVTKVRKALTLLVQYNCSNVKRGIS